MAKKRTKSKRTNQKPWEAFEVAVAAFLKTLLKDDPNATIRIDPPKKDRDTGSRQQVDAWIDYKVGGHLPIRMLISCKDRGRRVDVGAIRTFIQEIKDSGASTGALYSRSGFTKDAVKKANANGLACCQLWKNRPADKPVIEIYRRYWCWDSITVPVVEPGDAGFPPKTWDEFFDFRVTLGGMEQSLAEYIEAELRKSKDLAVKARESHRLAFPEDVRCVIDLKDSPRRSTKITVECPWKRYQGKLSAALLNGSYCVNSGHFVGTETAEFPVTYPPPVSDWEEMSMNPPQPVGVKNFLFTRNSAGLMKALRDALAGKRTEKADETPAAGIRITTNRNQQTPA